MNELEDRFGRRFSYLRLSLTEACNYRCSYCLPDGYDGPSRGFLTRPEIGRVLRAFVDLGMTKLRLTVARGQARDRVLAVLAALPDEQREVWALTELEAMTAAEIAEALDISPNTVSSRLRLARQTIARRLAALRSEGVSP